MKSTKFKLDQITLIGTLALGFALLFLRAGVRIINPQVWSEDGTVNLVGFFSKGLSSLLDPVNGYLIIVPKLITILSASISVYQYPLVSTALAWVVIVGVFFLIAKAPVQLSGGVLLASVCFLIPSDPEVFGLPLYTFWWVSLLLFLLVFWETDARHWLLRTGIVFFASLSSPVIIPVLPLLWVRGWILRKNKIEFLLVVWATVCAAVQLAVMHHAGSIGQATTQLGLAELALVIPKFLGAYAIGNIYQNAQWFFGLLLFVVMGIGVARQYRSWVMYGLVYLWCVAVFMTISRVGINIIHQAHAGPRYYFYPFILQGWIFLQIAIMDENLLIKKIARMVVIFSIINMLPVVARKHDDLNWQLHLDTCENYDSYMLPIQSDGNAAQAWSIPMSDKQCFELLNSDPLRVKQESPTLPYRVLGKYGSLESGIGSSTTINSLVKNEWKGVDWYSYANKSMSLSGIRIVGSFVNSDEESGEIEIYLSRGDRLWFRSEPRSRLQKIIVDGGLAKFQQNLPPTSEWVLLEFSNKKLPDQFTVKFVDGGGGWGEWSAVGLSPQ